MSSEAINQKLKLKLSAWRAHFFFFLSDTELNKPIIGFEMKWIYCHRFEMSVRYAERRERVGGDSFSGLIFKIGNVAKRLIVSK